MANFSLVKTDNPKAKWSYGLIAAISTILFFHVVLSGGGKWSEASLSAQGVSAVNTYALTQVHSLTSILGAGPVAATEATTTYADLIASSANPDNQDHYRAISATGGTITTFISVTSLLGLVIIACSFGILGVSPLDKLICFNICHKAVLALMAVYVFCCLMIWAVWMGAHSIVKQVEHSTQFTVDISTGWCFDLAVLNWLLSFGASYLAYQQYKFNSPESAQSASEEESNSAMMGWLKVWTWDFSKLLFWKKSEPVKFAATEPDAEADPATAGTKPVEKYTDY